MRKFNAILTAVILVLFVLHAVLGSFLMLGVGETALKRLARVNAALILVHAAIGVKYTVDTLVARKRAGVGYFKENRLFWARRISGLAVMVLLFFHMFAFGYTEGGVFHLKWFTAGRLAAQILLVVALAVHVISNVRPMLISFGIKSLKEHTGGMLFVLSVLLLFMAAAFIYYYLLWNVL